MVVSGCISALARCGYKRGRADGGRGSLDSLRTQKEKGIQCSTEPLGLTMNHQLEVGVAQTSRHNASVSQKALL